MKSTYGPSMLVDIEDGRPTEGEHTIGDLVERATNRDVNVPILNAARCNLQAYEINRSSSRRAEKGDKVKPRTPRAPSWWPSLLSTV